MAQSRSWLRFGCPLDETTRVQRIRRRLCALGTSDVIKTAGCLLADILELAPALPTRSWHSAGSHFTSYSEKIRSRPPPLKWLQTKRSFPQVRMRSCATRCTLGPL